MERLRAERLDPSHFSEVSGLHRDERVMATLGGLREAEETRQGLRDNLEHWCSHGFGLFIFRDRATGAFVGRAGLRRIEIGGRDEVELAYVVAAERWGEGLATEMAEALVGLAFGELGLRDVVAFTLAHNAASRRVMEKTGFAYERDVEHAGLPHVLYRRRAGE